MRKYVFYLLSVFILFVLSSCQSAPSKMPATVERVVDGDTLKVQIGKREETVRLLLVDTPESVHPTKPVQPFGPEASQYVKKLLPPGTKVELELDVRERDKYGRLLAYVWIGKKMLNELLLEKGYARVAYVFEPNTKYVDEFRRIQEEARKKRLNIWSIEDYATDHGFREEAVRPSEATASCPKPLIKGNITKNGEKIYHVPGSPQYNATKAEVMFCTEKEAQAAGFRKPSH
ncbi:thermonuclease family protein [Anoxybacillus sp. J5B_2022]|uniref:thermonuclease family protein n=1 Tax=Anoxybacillus sp. J5B_2022 TaxID=3003246 RepID=UPI002285502A|nr:thermonuclease family protein [Anoxybacillus sp. J5B_2022]MCZ0756443.1 thermonuclease family protein [Anoxybacillus sp. J5B_2022]